MRHCATIDASISVGGRISRAIAAAGIGASGLRQCSRVGILTDRSNHRPPRNTRRRSAHDELVQPANAAFYSGQRRTAKFDPMQNFEPSHHRHAPWLDSEL